MISASPLISLMLDLGSADRRVRLQAVQQITAQLAVPGFIETLVQHRLTPFVYHSLTQFTREEVGEVPLFEALRRDYLGGLKHYRNQESEVRLLMQVLASAGVESILLKGADVRHRLYSDPVCRPMSDLDVLISLADLEKVRIILKQQGYTLAPVDVERGSSFNARFAWEEMHVISRKYRVFLDLHWEIRKMGTYYRLPYAPLRARATVRDMDDVTALVLCPEHLLMSLCLNTFEEFERAGVLKIMDLDRALSRLPIDWDFFLEDSATFHIQGPMYRILREMEKLRVGAVPVVVRQRLAAYSPGWAESIILRRGTRSFLLGSLAALWRHHPLREWPALFQGKLWPNSAYIQANMQAFNNRLGYLQHLLRRTRAKT